VATAPITLRHALHRNHMNQKSLERRVGKSYMCSVWIASGRQETGKFMIPHVKCS
jgi:hypothetical protein